MFCTSCNEEVKSVDAQPHDERACLQRQTYDLRLRVNALERALAAVVYTMPIATGGRPEILAALRSGGAQLRFRLVNTVDDVLLAIDTVTPTDTEEK